MSIPSNQWAVYKNGTEIPNTQYKITTTNSISGDTIQCYGQAAESFIVGDVITLVNKSGLTNGPTADGTTINASIKIFKIG